MLFLKIIYFFKRKEKKKNTYNLYTIVVLPALSRPTMTILKSSFDIKIESNFDIKPPIFFFQLFKYIT